MKRRKGGKEGGRIITRKHYTREGLYDGRKGYMKEGRKDGRTE